MRLEEFEIKSYRSCLKTKLLLNDKLTSLIGINGAGKSNILNGILLLKKICSARYITVRDETSLHNKCNFSCKIKHGGKKILLKGDIIFETDERNNDEIQYSKVKWNFTDYTTNSKWIEIPIDIFGFKRNYELFFDSSKQIYKGLGRKEVLKFERIQNLLTRELIPILQNVVNFFSNISYYSASQFSDPSRCPVSIELLENRPMRRFRTSSGHEQFMLDLYYSYKAQDKEFKRYINTITKSGIGLVEDISFDEINMPSSSYKVQSGGKIVKIERSRLLIIPRITVEGNILSPNQLSEGTFKTLALLFYVLTNKSNLLLIEEPEVCIHHGLLSSVITLIKSQSRFKQIIISTHSDFVLDHLEPEDLIIIKRLENEGTIASKLTKSLSKNDFKALRQYLEESGNLGDYWREGGLENE